MAKAIAGTINVQVTTPIKELADVAVWMYEALGVNPRSASQIMATALRTFHSALIKDGLLSHMSKNEEEAFEVLKKVFGITLTPKYNDMNIQRQIDVDRTPGMADFVREAAIVNKSLRQIEKMTFEPVSLAASSISAPISLKERPFTPSQAAEDEIYEEAKTNAAANDPTDFMDSFCAEQQKNKSAEEESAND